MKYIVLKYITLVGGENITKATFIVESVTAVLISALTWFFGGYDKLFQVLIAFIVIDFISGLMVGSTTVGLDKDTCFKGINRKILTLLLVVVAHLIDYIIYPEGQLTRTVAISFYISSEGISIVENADKLGLAVPKKMLTTLKQFKAKAEGTDESEVILNEDSKNDNTEHDKGEK